MDAISEASYLSKPSLMYSNDPIPTTMTTTTATSSSISNLDHLNQDSKDSIPSFHGIEFGDDATVESDQMNMQEMHQNSINSNVYVEFSDDIFWLPAYQRNNKANGQKNIRCFPNHTPGMGHQSGWCGHAVRVNVRYNPNILSSGGSTQDTLIAFAEFMEEGKKGYMIEDELSYDTLISRVRCERDPLLPVLQGLSTTSETLSDGSIKTAFDFNRTLKGWHYGFVGSKVTRNYYHVMRVFLMVFHQDKVTKKGSFKVVGRISSPPWQLYCRRRNKGKQGLIKHQMAEDINMYRAEAENLAQFRRTVSSVDGSQNPLSNSFSSNTDDMDDNDDDEDDDVDEGENGLNNSGLPGTSVASSSTAGDKLNASDDMNKFSKKRSYEGSVRAALSHEINTNSIPKDKEKLNITPRTQRIRRKQNDNDVSDSVTSLLSLRKSAPDFSTKSSSSVTPGILSLSSPSQIADHRFGMLTGLLKMVNLPLPLPFLSLTNNESRVQIKLAAIPPASLQLRSGITAENFGDRAWSFCLHWYDLHSYGWSPRFPRNVAALDEQMRLSAYSMQQQEFSECVLKFVKECADANGGKSVMEIPSTADKFRVTSFFLQLLQRIFSAYWTAIYQQYQALTNPNASRKTKPKAEPLTNITSSLMPAPISKLGTPQSSNLKKSIFTPIPLPFTSENSRSPLLHGNQNSNNNSPGMLSNFYASSALAAAATSAIATATKDNSPRPNYSSIDRPILSDFDLDMFTMDLPETSVDKDILKDFTNGYGISPRILLSSGKPAQRKTLLGGLTDPSVLLAAATAANSHRMISNSSSSTNRTSPTHESELNNQRNSSTPLMSLSGYPLSSPSQ